MTDPIKAKIQELVPEVMANTKGTYTCPFQFCQKDTPHYHRIFEIGNDDPSCHLCQRENGSWKDDGTYFVCPWHTKEIGETMQLRNTSVFSDSPITLAVVLRAIEKADVGLRVELSTYGDKLLMGQYEKPEQQGYYCHAYWNLSKDNLDDQSEEFKRFLGKLLGV